MKIVVPDYYFDFQCAMGKCLHTCCANWEIDIDETSMAIYSELPENMRDDIFSGINCNTDPPTFKMQKNGRCAFLRNDGLCSLILKYGEDILCDICTDHPRFRNYLGNTEEIGLGLCCEAAGKLILTRESPMTLATVCDDRDYSFEYSADDYATDEIMNKRTELISAAQNRELTILERVRFIEQCLNLKFLFSASEIAQFLLTLERMDDNWTALLKLLISKNISDKTFAAFCAENEILLEQLLVYLLFRHIPTACDDSDFIGHAAFCIAMWKTLASLGAVYCSGKHNSGSTDSIIDICRIYSSEIEYSDENPQKLLLWVKNRTTS